MTYLIDPEESERSKTLALKLTGASGGEIAAALKKIPPSQTQAILTLLAPTHSLYFKERQLVVDVYTKVEFYYLVERLSPEAIQVEGRLKWGSHDIPLSECDFVGFGHPPWFIKGISLKLIDTPISSKELKAGKWILKGVEKNHFLEEMKEAIVFKGEPPATTQNNPMPLLILKDRTGAFADLWMDYGEGYKIAFHDGAKEIKAKLAVKRHMEAEKGWEKDLLETGFKRKILPTSQYYCPLDQVGKSLTFLLEIGWHIQDWQGNHVLVQTGRHLTLEEQPQAILVKGHVSYQNYQANLADVVGAFNRRDRFIQLAPGQVGLLTTDFNLVDLVEEGEVVEGGVKLKKSRRGLLEPLLEQAEKRGPLELLPSSSFSGVLRPYQQQGLNWLSFLAQNGLHGLLADDMGLGKTVQVLALLSRLPKGKPHLIIMPTSLLFNWKKEIEHFLPTFSQVIHQGAKRGKTAQELLPYDIILTSYATLRLDLPLFSTLSYQTIILDEAQAIKNAETQVAQAVCQLHAPLRLSISGTPVENHLYELWSHFRFLLPDLFGSQTEFEAEIQTSSADSRHLQRIKKKIAPFILRRKKEEVAKDLPERIEQVVWVKMGDEQQRLYDQFLSGIKTNLMGKNRLEILEAILRLRQICCHPLLVTASEENPLLCSAKWEAMEQDIETAIEENRKVLIYSQFTTLLKWMARQAKEKGWRYTYLDGGCRPKIGKRSSPIFRPIRPSPYSLSA